MPLTNDDKFDLADAIKAVALIAELAKGIAAIAEAVREKDPKKLVDIIDKQNALQEKIRADLLEQIRHDA